MAEMADMAHLYRMITCKLDDFVQVVDTHTLWLEEIQEAAEKMFNSNFNPEPEIMPKTPSQKNRRRKKRLSVAKDENKTSNKKRLSRRRSNIKHSLRLQNKENNLENVVNAVEDKPQRMTRAAARAILATSISTSPSEKEHSAIVHMEGKVPLVEISVNDRGIAEFSRKGYVPEMVEKFEIMILSSEDEKSPSKKAKEPSGAEVPVLVVPETPEDGSLKRADPSIPRPEEQDCAVKEQGVLVDGRKAPDTVADVSLEDLAKGSKPVRRSGRRSRLSLSKRRSLFDQYSLASKRESMNKAAIRRSVRKSLSRKKAALGSSASSCLSSDSVEMVEEEPVVPDSTEANIAINKREDLETGARSKTESKEPVEQVSEEPRMSLRTRNVNKIAISNLPAKAQAPEPEQEQGKTLLRTHKTCTKEVNEKKKGSDSDQGNSSEEIQCTRRNSYKRALAEIQDGTDDVDGAHSPAKKKTPSPPWPANKVIHPHMKTFLHTVKKNQLLMTPGSIGSNMVVKSFIKRNTPQKVDSKEKEWQRLETLRKKQEAEEKRKQKIEEEKKRKLEEVKRKREERLQRVMRARERVEQQEEEKKKKIEQKFAHFDEKSEKAREERIAEEKAKKKVALKKMEEAEARRRQEEEARKQKLQQQEEEERKHKELLQKKREEEEQERLKKIAEAKKQAEQRQAELERERQREQQLAAERALERKKALEKIQAEKERERQEKEKALQLQRELERVAREEAAREKERLRKEVEEKEKQRLEEVERQRQEQEKQAKLRKEQEEKERKLQEEKRAKEQQATASEKLANTAVVKKQQTTAGEKLLNVTVDINSPTSESYEMTPKGSGKPKASKNNLDNYGMDLNSDDSTDDEGAPRKAIPAWADGQLLHQAIIHQYYNPVDVDKKFGVIASPDLEQIFSKSKPRYFKRTSSAVWHSPPTSLNRSNLSSAYILKKF
ncbi:inner centromere protein A [Latimeria chalumnae]|uniref:inner centromere protein A n=1 Tax=Latimeria chalumnae TaxID=7897 RepID=UPI0003C1ADAB|nr:PREDICTED: inner centromere protein [Latimeria chalumnae]|eukprot:XP_005988042.1 PREDICTED: inner centromere protein [Latimeria chalumnae]